MWESARRYRQGLFQPCGRDPHGGDGSDALDWTKSDMRPRVLSVSRAYQRELGRPAGFVPPRRLLSGPAREFGQNVQGDRVHHFHSQRQPLLMKPKMLSVQCSLRGTIWQNSLASERQPSVGSFRSDRSIPPPTIMRFRHPYSLRLELVERRFLFEFDSNRARPAPAYPGLQVPVHLRHCRQDPLRPYWNPFLHHRFRTNPFPIETTRSPFVTKRETGSGR
mmetsp:Transcript_4257/g.10114  ORF Transcript_4257/g.10114 Transcript_4257/m.10114 type:complete len:221 (+) Transcript_4257:572-1234(+)